MKKVDLGAYEDPDLVPVMNLVCVLIPLVLWTTTWVTFGEITVLQGGSGGGRAGQKSEEKRLRLVTIVTKNGLTVMAGRDVSADVMPEDSATGTKGRVDIPHRSLSMADIDKEMGACQAPTDPKAFNDCTYWDYMKKFVMSCYKNPQGQVKVPDLKSFNVNLRQIKDRAVQAFGDQLDDLDQLNIKAEDDIAYCQIIALMDMSRFRTFDYDWTQDKEMNDHITDLTVNQGVTDPFLDPKTWNDAMKRELLFPVVGFVN